MKNKFSLNQIAQSVGMTRPSLSAIVNMRSRCSVEKAFILEAITGIDKSDWVFYPERLAEQIKQLQAAG